MELAALNVLGSDQPRAEWGHAFKLEQYQQCREDLRVWVSRTERTLFGVSFELQSQSKCFQSFSVRRSG